MVHLTCVLLFATLLCVQAQELDNTTQQPARLLMMARSTGDSVVLRWGVTDHAAWRGANTAGYRIERYRILPNGSRVAGSTTVLTPQPLRPLRIDEWRSAYAPTDTLAGVAVEALYGAPIVTSASPLGSIVELATQQRMLHGMAHLVADMAPHIANGLALRFVDRNLKPGDQWFYEVSTNVDTSLLVFPQYVSRVVVGRSPSIPDVSNISVVELDSEIRLEWDPYAGGESWSGFYIEHSTDRGASWHRVSSMPYVFVLDPAIARTTSKPVATYTIANLPNYVERQYRIRGLTAFGELSAGGTVVTAAARDRTPPTAPSINRPQAVGDSAMHVTWSLQASDADLAGFYVGRSPGDEGPFESVSELLPSTAREFTDVQPRRGGTYYYVVTAVDTAGNFGTSVPFAGVFPDSVPPAAPSGLTASVDTNGVVTITWKPSLEDDLYGYRLFTANAADHEFTPFGPNFITDTFYVDTVTLRSLTEVVYYRLTAVDRNYNGSDFTGIVVKKPDILAPAAPGLTAVLVTADALTIVYQPSPSTDVVEHRIQRRMLGEQEWNVVHRDTASGQEVRSWTDTTAAVATHMEYAVDVVDDAGLVSPMSDVYTGRRIPRTTIKGVDGVTATFDPTENKVRIQWNTTGNSASFAVYRAVGTGALTLMAVADGVARSMDDGDIYGVNVVRYGVRVIEADGAESDVVEAPAITLGR